MPIELTAPKPREPARPRELKGWMVLMMLVGFFGTIIAVNVTMARLAIVTMPGLDARNGYEENQRYNAEIKRARAQTSAGWSADIRLGLAGQTTPLAVQMRDHDGKPIRGLSLKVAFHHPADRKADREAAMVEQASGVYAASVEGVRAGIWDVIVDAYRGSERVYETQNRVMLKE